MNEHEFWKERRHLEEMPFDKRFDVDGNSELCHATGYESLTARTGGMSSWILTEISSTEDNSVKQFCLQKFCRLFFANFFSLQKIPHVIYRKNKGDKKCLKKY